MMIDHSYIVCRHAVRITYTLLNRVVKFLRDGPANPTRIQYKIKKLDRVDLDSLIHMPQNDPNPTHDIMIEFLI
jgi:hypothetical protein